MKTNKRLLLGVVLLYLLVFMVPITFRPVSIMDEARYAEIPREMLATGEWVVPRLDGFRYFEKPVLGYWLSALSLKAFGENPFGVRFASAASAGLTALLVFLLIRREREDVRLATWGALVYISCLMALLIGVTAVLDSQLALFVTAALVAFFLASQATQRRARNGYLLLFGLACGGAFLIKGFLAFAVPVVTVVPYMLWQRRWKDLFRFAPLPLLVAVLVVLPWALMINQREPDFWRYFFWEEHIRRFFSDTAQHKEPFWYFVPVLLGGILPWTALLPASVIGWRRGARWSALTKYAVCWLVFPFLFFSASGGKLGTYILPCLAPLVILFVHGLEAYFEAGYKKALQRGSRVLGAAILVGAGVLLLVQLAPVFEQKAYLAHEGREWPLVVAALVVWSGCLFQAARVRAVNHKLFWFGVSPLAIMLVLPWAVPEQTIILRSATPFLEAHAKEVPADAILVSDEKYTHPVCWFFKRQDVALLIEDGPGEFAYGLTYDDSAYRRMDLKVFRRLLHASRGQRTVVLVTNRRRYEKFKEYLPAPVQVAYDYSIKNRHALVLAIY